MGQDRAAPPAGVTAPPTAPPTVSPPTFDAADLDTEFIAELQAFAYGGDTPSVETVDALIADAEALAVVWDIPALPDAKVIIGLAAHNRTALAVTDPSGDDVLVQEFFDMGYTSDDAAMLASSWQWVDLKSAKILGVLLSEGPA